MNEKIDFSDELPSPASIKSLQIEKNDVQLPEKIGANQNEKIVSEEWKIGDVILNIYEIKDIFTNGGMGLVYRVYHRGWNTDLVVKVPRPQFFTTERGKEIFKREAETWINLGLHPHIVSCYYVRDFGGIPRIFAEYVEGGTLKDWIEDGRLYEGGNLKTLKRILDISIQFAWGIHYAHEQGLVHQDIKPGNVMLTSNGNAKVTDFGLAQGFSDSQEIDNNSSVKLTDPSKTIVVKGSGAKTPAYCSPEQSKGQGLTKRTDIWSWAASILEMFTGGLQWTSGEIVEHALNNYLEEWTQNERTAADGIPKMPLEVEKLLRQCLKPSVNERLSDLHEATKQLENAYQRITGDIYPRKNSKPEKNLADSLNNRAISFSDLGKAEEALKLWDKALLLAPNHIETTYNRGLFLWRTAAITDHEFLTSMKSALSFHPNHEAGYFLLSQIHLERGDCFSALSILKKVEQTNSFYEEMKKLQVFVEHNLSSSGLKIKSLKHSFSVRSLAISQNGLYALSFDGQKTLSFWNLKKMKCENDFQVAVELIRFHNGAPRLAIDNSGRLSLSTIGFINESSDHDAPVTANLRSWDPLLGRKLHTFKTTVGDSVGAVTVSLRNNHNQAVSGYVDGSIKLWDLSTGRCIRTFIGHLGQITSIQLSSDGNLLISGDETGSVKLWNVNNAGKNLKELNNHQKSVLSVAISFQNSLAITAGHDGIRIWNLVTGQLERAFCKNQRINSVIFINEHLFAAINSENVGVEIFELVTGRCLRTFENESSGSSHSVSILNNGKYLLTDNDTEGLVIWQIHSDYEYLAPTVLSKIRTTQDVLNIELEYQNSLKLSQKAFEIGDFITAARHLKKSRALPGYETATEALELWTRLYPQLPRKQLKAAIEVNAFAEDSKINHIQLTADGSLAAYIVQNELKILNLQNGRNISISADVNIERSNLRFSADGKYVFFEQRQKVFQWESITGNLVRVFEHFEDITLANLTDDGRFMRSFGTKTLYNWEIETGKFINSARYTPYSSELTKILKSSPDRINDPLYTYNLSGDMTTKPYIVYQKDSSQKNVAGYMFADKNSVVSKNGKYLLEFPSISNSKKLKLFILDWELEEQTEVNWDEKAHPFLDSFLNSLPLPSWDEEQFCELVLSLKYAGLGWINTDGIFKELKKISTSKKIKSPSNINLKNVSPKILHLTGDVNVNMPFSQKFALSAKESTIPDTFFNIIYYIVFFLALCLCLYISAILFNTIIIGAIIFIVLCFLFIHILNNR